MSFFGRLEICPIALKLSPTLWRCEWSTATAQCCRMQNPMLGAVLSRRPGHGSMYGNDSGKKGAQDSGLHWTAASSKETLFCLQGTFRNLWLGWCGNSTKFWYWMGKYERGYWGKGDILVHIFQEKFWTWAWFSPMFIQMVLSLSFVIDQKVNHSSASAPSTFCAFQPVTPENSQTSCSMLLGSNLDTIHITHTIYAHCVEKCRLCKNSLCTTLTS